MDYPIWHPCSQMKDHEVYPIIRIKKAKGVYLYDEKGNSYIDGISSWWVNLFGHSNKRLNNAIKKQLEVLEQVIFAGFTHDKALELSQRLLKIVPKNLKKIFFAEIGSSAVEISLKLSYHYFKNIGIKGKNKFVYLENGYHGETLGALSVMGEPLYKNAYEDILIKNIMVEFPNCYRCPFGKTRNNCDVECFSFMEKTLSSKADCVAGVIVEPLVQFAGGFKMYPSKYLSKLRELTKKLNIHLILDEIATGFGRTGTMFALEQAQIEPDFLCLSKGITSGYLPLSVVLTTDEIYNAFYDDYSKGKNFLHSHSYDGNALACACACETLNIFEDENVLENNKKKYTLMRQLIENYFKDFDFVGDIRHTGFISAIEFVKDKYTKMPIDSSIRFGFKIYRKALEKGVLLRNLGDLIYFLPPYVIDNSQIEQLVESAYFATKEVIDENFC
ncbi:adenosylmethionine--8-amino-7-oxononanoate transaminase [Desulfurella sp.]|uniref:adenosylmethionine--8-amino-7-oxononanoate transaminase n=1 Tax=Desulfurella sp. TaxID=1962857 RepID=UPI003D0AA4D5